ncbi:zinc finger protein 510-like isoform X2 [Littorina saxatilis]
MDASGMSAVRQSPLQTESTTYSKPFTWKDGIRLVDLAELAKQLRCNRCSTLLDLNNTQDESRVGFASVLSVRCLCGELNDVRTGKIQESDSVVFEINMKVSMNMLLCGAGGQHVINFLAILDVPLPGDASLITPPSPPPTTASPNATVTLPGDTSHVMPPLLYCATTPANATVTLPRMATASSNSGELFYQHTGSERDHFSSSSQFPSQPSANDEEEPSAGDSSEMPVVLSNQIKKETVDEVLGTETRDVNSYCNNGVTAAQGRRSESVHKHISGDDGNRTPLPVPGLTRDQSSEPSVQTGAAETIKHPEGKGSSTIQRDDEFEETEMSYLFDTVTEESDEIDYEAVRKSAERKYYRCPLCPRVLPTSRGFIVHVSRMHHVNNYQAEHYELGPNCGYTGDKAQDAVGEDAIPMQATDSVSPAATEVHSPASSPQQKEPVISSSSQETQAAEDSVVQASDPEQTEQETAAQSGRRSLRAAKKSSGKKKTATSTTSKFVCKIKTCDTRFESELRYKKHLVRVHHIEEPIACHQCSQQFDTHTNLKKHITCSHTPKEDKVVSCRYCHIPLPTSNAMKKHIKAVHPRGSKKCYPCDECPKTFARPCELKMHKLRHSGAKNYKCFFCDRSFAGSGNRLNHIKMVHDKNPKFLCETCGAGFYRACNLREHERIHSGERPFQCEVCAERFTKKEYLTIHMRTHTGERPYTCDECGKTFSQRCSRSLHRRKIHGVPKQERRYNINN